MRPWWACAAAIVLVGVGVAGCSGKQPAQPDDTGGLAVSDTTGILRGIVVDAGIRPLQGVTVTIQKPGAAPIANVSDAAGNWGFGALDPGTYAVTGELERHVPMQTVASVRAGEREPPIVRLLLEPDLQAQPLVVGMKLEGFLECGIRGGTGGASCQLVNDLTDRNLTSARSSFRFPIENGPSWMQAEMTWRASQPLADQMGFYFIQYEEDPVNNHYMGVYPLNQGRNPVLLYVDSAGVGHCSTCVEEPLNMTSWAELQVNAMAGEHSSTTPPPTCSPTGSPCLAGVGVLANQAFDIFLHIFYRTTPPEGWRFTVDGDPPQ